MDPEVWFRIVHVDMHGQNPVSHANGPIYRDQTVEIALGPKGAFENGNVGAVTRRVAADRVVSAAPMRRAKPKPPREPRTPWVVGLLRKAQEWRREIDWGEVQSQAEIARREGITRARVTQIMALNRLAPEIQDRVLSLPAMVHRSVITEKALRPIALLDNRDTQNDLFRELVQETE